MDRYNGNNAYRIRIQKREADRIVERENPRYERIVKDARKKIIGSMLIIMAVAMIIILRVAQISVLNTEIQTTQKRLEEAKAVQANLEIERDRVIDLSKIEEIAVEEYGMMTPNKDQIVYISVAREDSVKVAAKTGISGFFAGLFASKS